MPPQTHSRRSLEALRSAGGRDYLSDYENLSTVVFLFYFGLVARKNKNWENNKIVEMNTRIV